MRDLQDLEMAFDRGLNAWEGSIVQQQAAKMGLKCIRGIKRKTPVKTGNLRRRWSRRVETEPGDAKIILENDADYAAAVNNGHRIMRGGQTVGKKDGKHMLEKGIAAYKDKYLQEDLQEMLQALSGKMKG